ncbi:MAG: adenine phosphoribosyltransferase [Cyanobacteriota bacterium]|nr:adenine phosphoribosyltransferase [Cyanobacteriota bacterium]
MDLRSIVRDIPDFPKPGIVFRDITTLLKDSQALRYTVDAMSDRCGKLAPDYILGMESRGFLFGVPLAYQLEAGFVPARKSGKLPAPVYSIEYELEYGSDRLEMHQDAIESGSRVFIIDDLIATGGTAVAAAELVKRAGGEIVGFGFIVELSALGGREKLPPVPIVSLLEY